MRVKRSELLFVPMIVLTLLAAVPAAKAVTLYVNGQTGNDTNTCTTAQTACKTIGHAIKLAKSGYTISIAASTYTENLAIGVNLTLSGAAASSTIIDGGGITRVIAITSTTAKVTLSKLTIRNGVSAGGGGILNEGTLTVNYCTISGNTASGKSAVTAAGAGIDNSGSLTVNESTLTANTGTTQYVYGGGIYNDAGTVAINNSTFYANSANGLGGSGGGGIYNNGGTVTISNSTISGNSGTSGGGISNLGTVTLQNSIVANSSAGGNCSGGVTSNGYNMSTDGTCNFSGAGDLNNTDPQLGALQSNGGQTQTMALPNGSPAVDAGNPAGCTDNKGALLKTDQRGDPRPDKGDTSGCDMGAYENQTS